MKNNIQYFTNRQKYQGCKIPSREPGFLKVDKKLAEFSTSDDKEKARSNLGIPEIIKKLDEKIDSEVIKEGCINWDFAPTQGNYNKVLSSDVIYQTLLNYITKEELDQNTQELWTKTINKINDNYNKIEFELNETCENLMNCLNNLEQLFNEHSLANDQKYNKLIANYQKLLDHFGELKEFVREEYLNLYQTLYCNIGKKLIIPLEDRINQLQLLVNTSLKMSNGAGLTNQFGNDELIGVNQKTLTIALNDIWNKIRSITGEITDEINMSVNPQYFIGDRTTINVSATACENQTFEHVSFYANNVLLREADNVKDLTFSAQIEETSEIKCVVKILGIEHVVSKTVTKYPDNFFIFSGSFESTDQILSYAANHLEFSIPVTEGLRGNYDINCQDNDNIYIVMGKPIEEQFIRADLNGIEIPLKREVVTTENEEYIIFTSINTYNTGTYNIDING